MLHRGRCASHLLYRLVNAVKDKVDVRLAWVVRNKDSKMVPCGMAVVVAKQVAVFKVVGHHSCDPS